MSGPDELQAAAERGAKGAAKPELISGRRKPPKPAGPKLSAVASELEQEARASNSGFGFIELLPFFTAFLPILFGMCNDDDPVEQQARAQRAHNPDNIERPYSAVVLRGAMNRARHTARKMGERISQEQAKELAILSLDKVRTAESETFAEVWREVKGHPDTSGLLLEYNSGE